MLEVVRKLHKILGGLCKVVDLSGVPRRVSCKPARTNASLRTIKDIFSIPWHNLYVEAQLPCPKRYLGLMSARRWGSAIDSRQSDLLRLSPALAGITMVHQGGTNTAALLVFLMLLPHLEAAAVPPTYLREINQVHKVQDPGQSWWTENEPKIRRKRFVDPTNGLLNVANFIVVDVMGVNFRPRNFILFRILVTIKEDKWELLISKPVKINCLFTAFVQ